MLRSNQLLKHREKKGALLHKVGPICAGYGMTYLQIDEKLIAMGVKQGSGDDDEEERKLPLIMQLSNVHSS